MDPIYHNVQDQRYSQLHYSRQEKKGVFVLLMDIHDKLLYNFGNQKSLLSFILLIEGCPIPLCHVVAKALHKKTADSTKQSLVFSSFTLSKYGSLIKSAFPIVYETDLS